MVDSTYQNLEQRLRDGPHQLLATGNISPEDQNVTVDLALHLDGAGMPYPIGTITVPIADYPVIHSLLFFGATAARLTLSHELRCGHAVWSDGGPPV